MRIATLVVAYLHCWGAAPAESDAQHHFEVDRADLAMVYLRFDRAFTARPPPPERLASINQAFDEATLSFFAGDFGKTIDKVNAVGFMLNPEAAANPVDRVAASLGVRFDPPVFVRDESSTPVARVRPLTAHPLTEPLNDGILLRLQSAKDESKVDVKMNLSIDPDQEIQLTLPLPILEPSAYSASWVTPSGRNYPLGRWYVVDRSWNLRRADNEVRLAQLHPDSPGLIQALATCRARNTLLSDQPDRASSAPMVLDLAAVAADLELEISMLEAGRDPYRQKTGDMWRVVKVGDMTLPVRLYVPPLPSQDGPMPLLIAIHGAGGDENMFMEAYGAGRIKTLADTHNLLVAAPLAYTFITHPVFFDKLIEGLSSDYPIDPERIYVLGHSLGSAGAAKLATTRKTKIAAACCLAGGGIPESEALAAPLMVMAGELDPLIPLERIRRQFERGRSAGHRIEFRVMQDYGHTLMVGPALQPAIEWLLLHKLASDGADPPHSTSMPGQTRK